MHLTFNYQLAKGQENMNRKTSHHGEKQLRTELLLEKETLLSYAIITKLNRSPSKYFRLSALTLSRPIGSGCAVYMFLLPS